MKQKARGKFWQFTESEIRELAPFLAQMIIQYEQAYAEGTETLKRMTFIQGLAQKLCGFEDYPFYLLNQLKNYPDAPVFLFHPNGKTLRLRFPPEMTRDKKGEHNPTSIVRSYKWSLIVREAFREAGLNQNIIPDPAPLKAKHDELWEIHLRTDAARKRGDRCKMGAMRKGARKDQRDHYAVRFENLRLRAQVDRERKNKHRDTEYAAKQISGMTVERLKQKLHIYSALAGDVRFPDGEELSAEAVADALLQSLDIIEKVKTYFSDEDWNRIVCEVHSAGDSLIGADRVDAAAV